MISKEETAPEHYKHNEKKTQNIEQADWSISTVYMIATFPKELLQYKHRRVEGVWSFRRSIGMIGLIIDSLENETDQPWIKPQTDEYEIKNCHTHGLIN